MNVIPSDFAEAIEKAGMTDFFADCTASHQNEYLKWIGEAKKAETRAKRIHQAVQTIVAKCVEEKARPRADLRRTPDVKKHDRSRRRLI